MKAKNRAIIVFVKAAVIGNEKTRLAQRIEDVQALNVYWFLVRQTHQQLEWIDADIYVYFSSEPYARFNSNYHVRRQCEGDLGLRMATAFAEVFDAGFDQVLVIGTDCYELETSILKDAFQGLNDSDIVIGPAKNSDNYLLGLTKTEPKLFKGVKWSTPSVFTNLIEIADSLNKRVYLLPELNELDRYEDLGGLGDLLGVMAIDE